MRPGSLGSIARIDRRDREPEAGGSAIERRPTSTPLPRIPYMGSREAEHLLMRNTRLPRS